MDLKSSHKRIWLAVGGVVLLALLIYLVDLGRLTLVVTKSAKLPSISDRANIFPGFSYTLFTLVCGVLKNTLKLSFLEVCTVISLIWPFRVSIRNRLAGVTEMLTEFPELSSKNT